MSKREVHYTYYGLVLVLIIITLFIIKTGTNLIGGAVYEEESEKTWDFADAEEYSYEPLLVNLTGQQAKLIPELQEGEAALVSAFLRELGEQPHEKTEKVMELDGKKVNLNKESAVLDFTASEELENGDMVLLYLLESNVQTEVYLCNSGTACAAPGYGSVLFNGAEGWYQIVISGLATSVDTLAIDPPHHIKIDQIVIQKEAELSYPASAEIQTEDFEPEDIFQWGLFSATEQLNGQSIGYFYSADGGISWSNFSETMELNGVNSSRIRIKAVLNSDGTATPILSGMKLNYLTRSCVTELANDTQRVNISECQNNNQQLQQMIRTTYDLSQCGEVENQTVVENITVDCDYCQPSLINTTWTDWVNLSCLADNTMNQSRNITQYDSNFCGEVENQTFVEHINNEACEYCTPSLINVTTTDWYNISDCYSNDTIAQERNLTQYDSSFCGKVINQTFTESRYDNCTYTAPSNRSSSSSSSSGSGGGGSRKISTMTATVEAEITGKTETSQPTFTRSNAEQQGLELGEMKPETACQHVLEVLLPEKVRLVSEEKYEGEVINRGNCLIQQVNLYLSPELEEVASFLPVAITNLTAGESSKFIIIRKSVEKKGLFSLLTGSAITGMVTKTIPGQMTIEGVENNEIVFTQNLPVNIEMFAPEKLVKTGTQLGGMLLVMIVMGVLLIVVRKRKKKGKLFKKKGEK